MYVDPWFALVVAGFAIYGVEQLLVRVVRYIDRRSRKKPPTKPTILTP